MEPIGVLVPKTMAADVEAAMAICREEGIPILPRGGGTSQCGQTVNRALVLDCSKYLRTADQRGGRRGRGSSPASRSAR
jgi:FAD/FMN-containing dehydrogenase